MSEPAADDLRIDTYRDGSRNWSIRVTDLRTGRVLHGIGMGEDALQKAQRELCLRITSPMEQR